MSTNKIVDFGSAQTNNCRVMVDGETASFDPTASTATIKAAIEALSTMSGHTVTVTELTADQKWQFAFSFTMSTFFAAKSSDLGFANPYAISLGSTSLTPGTTNLPSPASGATYFARFKFPASPAGGTIFNVGPGSGNILYCAYYYTVGGVYLDVTPDSGASNAALGIFSWSPDTEWHTVCYRIPAAGNMSDVVFYFDGVQQSLTVSPDDAIAADSTALKIGDLSFASLPLNGYVDQFLVFDSDIGDSAAKALNDYATPASGCQLMLKMDGGTGSTVADSTANANDATLAGGGSWASSTTTTTITDAGGGSTIALTSDIAIQSAMTGSLGGIRHAAADISIQSEMTGSLLGVRQVAAGVSFQSAMTGSLGGVIPASAGMAIQSAMTGNLTKIPIAGGGGGNLMLLDVS